MSNNIGTLVGQQIRPISSEDTYAVQNQNEIKGGWHSVSNIQQRDAIPTLRREIGLQVYVQSEDKIYQLKNGIENTNWEEMKSGANINDNIITTENVWSATRIYNEIHYTPISILTFSLNPNIVEKGEILNNINMNYSFNTQSNLNKLEIIDPQTIIDYNLNQNSYVLSGLNISSNKTFTLKQTDSKSQTNSKNQTLTFLNKLYYGDIQQNVRTSENILSLPYYELRQNKLGTFSSNMTDQYFMICYPQSFGECYIKLNNKIIRRNYNKQTISFTNSKGYTENYLCYFSTDLLNQSNSYEIINKTNVSYYGSYSGLYNDQTITSDIIFDMNEISQALTEWQISLNSVQGEYVYITYPKSLGIKLLENSSGSYIGQDFDVFSYTATDDFGNSEPYYVYFSKTQKSGDLTYNIKNDKNYLFYGTNQSYDTYTKDMIMSDENLPANTSYNITMNGNGEYLYFQFPNELIENKTVTFNVNGLVVSSWHVEDVNITFNTLKTENYKVYISNNMQNGTNIPVTITIS